MDNQDIELDKKIDFLERKLLLSQDRLFKSMEKSNAVVKRLERQLRTQEEVKKEWLNKIDMERERRKTERNDSMKTHRHNIEDLRVKFMIERDNKLRDLKVAIQDEEVVIEDLRKVKEEEIMKTKVGETAIKAQFQERINDLLKEEQAHLRTGVVRQKRLLETPNIYSMSLERQNPVGMKRRASALQKRY